MQLVGGKVHVEEWERVERARRGVVYHTLTMAGMSYIPSGDMEEYLAIANLGLAKALAMYEPGKGSFYKYACIKMGGEVRTYLKSLRAKKRALKPLTPLTQSVSDMVEDVTSEDDFRLIELQHQISVVWPWVPRNERMYLVAVCMSDRSPYDIADEMGISYAKLRFYVVKALRRLRGYLNNA